MEVRIGHSTYLAFLLSGVNFLLISYRLLVEEVWFLRGLFPSLTVYVVFFLLVYVPLVALIGHLHRVKQMRTDVTIWAEQNPYLMEIVERVRRIEERVEERS